MRIGIGVDIEEIKRFRLLDSYQLEKIFTKKELKYCLRKRDPAPSLAARFAAKEAIIKAFCDAGKSIPMSFKTIEILNKKNGAPTVHLPSKISNSKVHISLSHCREKAIAIAIVIG